MQVTLQDITPYLRCYNYHRLVNIFPFISYGIVRGYVLPVEGLLIPNYDTILGPSHI